MAVDAGDLLWEGGVEVRVKNQDREWDTEALVAHVTTRKPARAGAGREVVLRLTSARDPFFLYSVRMCEDDYGRFKEENGLCDDFNGFPKMLVSLLQACGKQREGEKGEQRAELIIEPGGGGRLRIMESHSVRPLEVLGLNVARENDAGQKKYLAERAARLDGELTCALEERRTVVGRLTSQVERLQGEVETLRSERDGLRARLQTELSECRHAAELESQQLREAKERELREQQAGFEAERRRLEERHEGVVGPLRAASERATGDLERTKAELREVRQAEQLLREQLEAAEAKGSLAKRELATSRERVAQLEEEAAQRDRTLTENRLTLQRQEQEINHAQRAHTSLEDRARVLDESRDQLQRQAADLTQQLTEAKDGRKEKEQELEKAHRIITMQHRQLDTSKTKRQALAEQLACREQALAERELALKQHGLEADSLRERLQRSQDRADELTQQVAGLTADLNEQTAAREDLQRAFSRQVRLPPTSRVSADITDNLRAAVAAGGLHRDFSLSSRPLASTTHSAPPPAPGPQSSPPPADGSLHGSLVASLARGRLEEEHRAVRVSPSVHDKTPVRSGAGTSAGSERKHLEPSNFFMSSVA
eukprot:Hpha_TRINITY_DN16647_c3_g3::TRINITY_DN16647_c3_g3_i1::g.181480::m.181480/K16487/SAS-6, SASS6; spindle assembly abnormal protein 6